MHSTKRVNTLILITIGKLLGDDRKIVQMMIQASNLAHLFSK